ncbi:Rho GTPase [Pelomyxa schiedti]|nr:Rho GTPase [Pelomyxa schiedti]
MSATPVAPASGGGDRVKLVAVGDGAVGKTCLLICYAKNEFPEKYVPTVFENYVKVVNRPTGELCFELWDTAGQEDFDRLRPLSYPDTDIVLICFSLVSRRSFDNVKDRWYLEIRHYCPDVPTIVVGLKSDLRDANAADAMTGKVDNISTEEGQQVATSLGASVYMEASAKTRKGLDEVFTAAIDIAMTKKKPATPPEKKKRCSIL